MENEDVHHPANQEVKSMGVALTMLDRILIFIDGIGAILIIPTDYSEIFLIILRDMPEPPILKIIVIAILILLVL